MFFIGLQSGGSTLHIATKDALKSSGMENARFFMRLQGSHQAKQLINMPTFTAPFNIVKASLHSYP